MEAVKEFCNSTRRKLLLKALSVAAGVFLIIAGILGCLASILPFIDGGGFRYFVGCLYAVLFGLIVLVVEVKDKTPVVSAAYDLVDKYLKFLTLQVCRHHP